MITEEVFVLPTSFAQQRLWLLDQLEPGSATYNLAAGVRLRGRLDVHALDRAVNEVVRRHESLRTTFDLVEDEPIQIVTPELKIPLSIIDLRMLCERHRAGELERLSAYESGLAFDLYEGPLLRMTLLRDADSEWLLLVTMHHIISDGWSVGIFIDEVAALYGAFIRNEPSPLPELPIQYGDFAQWQRTWMEGGSIESEISYWRAQLAGTPAALELPCDRLRPRIRTFSGACRTIFVTGALTVGLKDLAAKEHATLFMILLAAFKLLLFRFTGQDEIAVGTPVAGRNRTRVERLIGFFLNTLVLRTDLSNAPTFRELVTRVRRCTIDAYSHQDVPFERLLEELSPERDLSRTPLFQVFFNMLNFPKTRIELPDLTAETVSSPQVDSKFDLTLYVEEQEGGLKLDLVYNGALFDDVRMAEMIEQYKHLLSQIVGDSEKKITGYSLLTTSAKQVVPDPAAELNAVWSGGVPAAFKHRVELDPNRIAVVDATRVWTYGELDSETSRIANYLIEHGVGREDVVAVYAYRSAQLVAALMGVIKAGAAFVVLDPVYPAARHLLFLEIAKPKGWIHIEGAGSPSHELLDWFDHLSCRLELRDLPDGSALSDLGTYSADDPEVTISPEDAVYVSFTSGSTGKPKGIVGRHLSLGHFAPWAAKILGLSEQDRFTALSGLSHDPLHRDIFTPLQLGATICIPDPSTIGSPGRLAKWMKEQAITVTNLTPAMGQVLNDAADEDDQCEIPSLRFAFFVGDVLTRRDVGRLKKMAPAIRIVNLYGSTETSRAVGHFIIPQEEPGSNAGHSEKEILPLGRGIDGVQLIILNEFGLQAGIGEIGEIHFRSPYLARGYLGDEALTTQRFIDNPFTREPGDRLYRTGDLGRYLPDGNVESLGRADNQVKIRGFRVELGEIEAVLGQHPAIRETAVIAREDSPGNKCLIAYLVPNDGWSASAAEMRGYLKGLLPDYMVPSAYVTLGSLPLTPNKKLDRRALPAPPETIADSVFVAPRNETEGLVAGVWADVIGLDRVGIYDNFFEVGGHSLSATRVISRIRALTGVDLTLRGFFESPTVSEAAEIIEKAQQWAGSAETGRIVSISRDQRLPLSFGQQRVWFLNQLQPGLAAYNIAAAFRLVGPLDVPALESALNQIVQRHESLRTTFASDDDGAFQQIAESPAMPLRRMSIICAAPEDRNAEASKLAAEDARIPFDLRQGPLLRTTLLQFDDEDHVLAVTVHHIVFDGWSLSLFTQELGALYEAIHSGRENPLRELTIQYADYAYWQRRTLNQGALESQLQYWQESLAGLEQLELPADRPRPPIDRSEGDRTSQPVSSELLDRLSALSRMKGATLFMTLLAAFQSLLYRYSGQEEIAVGTPVSSRSQRETEGLIGFFVNTLVMRSRVRGGGRFEDLLRQVRETALQAYSNQDVPFEQLVDRLALARDLSSHPLFQVMLAVQNVPAPRINLPDLEVTSLPVHNGASKFDLSLSAIESGEGITLFLEYNTALFDESTAERILAHLQNILSDVSENAGRLIHDLRMLTGSEELQLVKTCRAPLVPYPVEKTIVHFFEEQARRAPDIVAVVFEDLVLTYSELNRWANRLSHYLRDIGAGRDVIVGICMERSLEMVVALLGVLKSGGAYLPLDPEHPVDRLAFMIKDAGLSIVLTQEALIDRIPAHLCSSFVVDSARKDLEAKSDADPFVNIRPENLAYVIYTSGSTGKPKAVLSSHGGLSNRLQWMQDRYRLDQADAVAQKTSYTFDVSVWEFFWPLMFGARLVVARPGGHKDARYLLNLIECANITTVHFVPAMLDALLNEAEASACASLKRVICSGEALTYEVQERFFQRLEADLENLYGPTEASIDVTHWSCRLDYPSRVVPIGEAISNIYAPVLDRDLNLAPVGVPGELFLGGIGVARGYLNRSDLTAEKFVPDPFAVCGQRLYRTGDRARRMLDGNIEYLGRLDHQIKIRGYRVELAEIECILREHPLVAESVVVIDQSRGYKQIIGYVTTRREHTIANTGLRGFLKTRLPEYMVPAEMVVLSELPRTRNGKLDRRALPKPALLSATPYYVSPRTAAEHELARIWRDVLRIERVGVDDNFFEAGGDSILALQIVSRAGQAGIHVELKDLFQRQTIAQLALCAGAGPSGAAAEVDGRPVPLTPIQHWFFEQDLADAHHFNQAVMLDVSPGLTAAAIDRIVRHLVQRHDALRLRFIKQDGGHQQVCEAVEKNRIFLEVDLTAIEARAGAEVERVTADLHRSLDLARGPLIRVALFHRNGFDDRLFIVIHHLAVDAVSWSILLGEMEKAYDQMLRDEPIELGRKSTSFRQWAVELARWGEEPALRKDAQFWIEMGDAAARVLPVDYPHGINDVASVRKAELWFSEEQTRLLRDAANSCRAHVEDVLITALAVAVNQWSSADRFIIDLEAHGRDAFSEGLDVASTVGWFTSMFPVVIEVGKAGIPIEHLKTVKEQVRKSSARGRAFGLLAYLSGDEFVQREFKNRFTADISFNYLGRLDHLLREGGMLRSASDASDGVRSGLQKRRYKLEVNGAIVGGRLLVRINYGAGLFRSDSIEQLTVAFENALNELIESCASLVSPVYTPSDFPLAKLSQETLDELAVGAGIEDIYGLSPAQEGMLFHDLFEPNNGLYLLQLNIGLKGELDRPALKRAWQDLVARHPVFRSGFRWTPAGDTIQIVHREAFIEFGDLDLTADFVEEKRNRLESYLASDRARGFDPAEPPLIRVAIIEEEEERFRIICSYHHLIMDGWSLPIVLRDLFRFYEAHARGRPVQLERGSPYKAYIEWLRAQDLAIAEAYWRGTLQDVTAATPIGIEKSLRDRDGRAGYAEAEIHLSIEATASLNAAAKAHQLTAGTAVQGMWVLLLSRYTGESEVVYGAVVSGRPAALAGVERIVGPFINTLPVVASVQGEAPACDWLRVLQNQLVEMRNFEYSPLAKVQGWSGIRKGARLFESIVAYENYPVDQALRPEDADIQVTDYHIKEQTHYPVTLVVLPGERLSIRAIYDKRLFEPPAAGRMVEHLGRLLENVAEDLTRHIDSLNLLGDAERQKVVYGWNDTHRGYPSGRCIHQMFEDQVDRAPHAVAVVHGGRRITYAALNSRANQLAHYLISLGVGPESVAGVCLSRTPDLIVALLAVLKVGGAYLPLDPAYPGARLTFSLEESGARALLTESALLNLLPRHPQCVLIDQERSRIAQGSETNPAVNAADRNLAYIIYTSGSTGTPKGVAIEHRSAARFVEWSVEQYTGEELNGVLASTSICFDISVYEIFAPLSSGGKIIFAQNILELLDMEARNEVRLIDTVPSAMTELVKAGGVPDSVITVNLAGEALPQKLVDKVYAASNARRVLNLYGPTEDTTYSTYAIIEKDTAVTIGRPISNSQVYILDRRMEPAPVGAAGEIYIGGEGLARGYLNRPELTAERFIPDRFTPGAGGRLYTTGDLARYLEDGRIEYLGRKDNQIKLRGFRIELGEIESVIAQHPSVESAVVIVQEAPRGDKQLTAYVVGNNGAALSSSELRNFVREKLPEYMTPALFVTLDALPLTPNGKVNRRELQAPEDQHRCAFHSLEGPRSDLEKTIAEIWKAELSIQEIGVHDNFFDLGGHSLLLVRVHSRLKAAIKRDIPIVSLFEHPTISLMAAYLSEAEPLKHTFNELYERAGAQRRPAAADGIAIIGMSGRFPGARNIEEFWTNLSNGVESISFFPGEELGDAAASAAQDDPSYVAAGALLEGADLFDGSFFGLSPREAELTDPQQRIFLECASEALENAGYDSQRYEGLVGVYAGAGVNSYLLNVLASADFGSVSDRYQMMLGAAADHLTARVSYKLNLRGPSVNVQTACSSSLVAVHMACRSLRERECDVALAGGVSIAANQGKGYVYQKGMIFSPDGHCRAFDAKAAGTVGGSGLGIVVLKRLEDAIADGDHIRAVIRGTAINNDGSQRVGYTAPGVAGQSAVIAAAQATAGIEPDTVTYIEAHGTGTELGDPIEIEALTRAFRARTDKKCFCAVGSVKTNIGHLDAAAGVAGLIKTVLALEHKQLPPSLHFDEPNPKIDFQNSPFYVNSRRSVWEANGSPRRAGVSSFGIGGTNAHVVLEEAPPAEPRGESREWQLLLLSARTEAALDKASSNLASYLRQNPAVDIADVAFTLKTGRRAFNYRRALVCASKAIPDAADRLDSLKGFSIAPEIDRQVVFMFPGQGSQQVNMGRGLYESEPVFKQNIDKCSELLLSALGLDLRSVLYPAGSREPAAAMIDQTCMTQPALFVVEYALARLWESWGVRPAAMIGHSIGEYVAAHLAGVLSLEDALWLVSERGKLMQSLPGGSMLAVSLPADEIEPLLSNPLSIAAVNWPESCVVSGPSELINGLKRPLDVRGAGWRLLNTSHAFHSPMVEPILNQFGERISNVDLNPPQIPYVSNLTGAWITDEEATDPNYWISHLRNTVRFADGLRELRRTADHLFVEVGPGSALSRSANRCLNGDGADRVAATLPDSSGGGNDVRNALLALGKLWTNGASVDWRQFYSRETRRRTPLPAYPFERQRYWLEPDESAGSLNKLIPCRKRKTNVDDWFYLPGWRLALNPRPFSSDRVSEKERWLIFADQFGIEPSIRRRLLEAGHEVITLTRGDRFAALADDSYAINPYSQGDYEELFTALRASAKLPTRIAHLWTVSPDERCELSLETFDRAHVLGFESLINVAKAFGSVDDRHRIDITVVSSNLFFVTGNEAVRPEMATMLGPCKVISHEYPNLNCRFIDAGYDLSKPSSDLIDNVIAELTGDAGEEIVAYRSGRRWIPSYDRTRINQTGAPLRRFRQRGVYLITGGMGGIGLALAAHLATTVQARLVLVSRSPFPDRVAWTNRLSSEDEISQTIRKLLDLEARGGEVAVLSADVADPVQMKSVFDQVIKQFGTINGVLHAAGLPGDGLIHFRSIEAMREVIAPKAAGLIVLEELSRGLEDLDFILLFSSMNSIVGGAGQADYTGANAFLDAFASRKAPNHRPQVLSINWCAWQEAGMAAAAALRSGDKTSLVRLSEDGLTINEGMKALDRVLSFSTAPQIIVYKRDLNSLLGSAREVKRKPLDEMLKSVSPRGGLHPRPDLSTLFVEPSVGAERIIADIWQQALGVTEVGANDNFFELGGDSLIAARIMSQVQRTFGVDAPLRSLIEAQSVARLAEVVEAGLGQEGRSSGKAGSRMIPKREAAERIPLSYAQQTLWFLDQLRPGRGTYNIYQAIRITGALEVDLFQRSLQEVVRRQEVLRTTFKSADGAPFQVIQPATPVELPSIDLRTIEGAALTEELKRLISEEAQRPFDLAQGPLLRMGLIRTSEFEYALTCALHHIIGDAYSLRVLIREVQTIYMALLKGREHGLAELAIQYADYACWQRKKFEGRALEEMLSYWRERLSGAPAAAVIPPDKPRPSVQTDNGAIESVMLSEPLTRVLQTFSQAEKVTLFMTLTAAFNVLVYYYSGQEDVVIGTNAANRDHFQTEGLIGFFINQLVLRTDLAGNPSFRELIRRVRETCAGAYAHQELPFDKLVQVLKPERKLSRHPVFQIKIDFVEAPPEPDGATGLKLAYIDSYPGAVHFDLTLSIENREAGLKLDLIYNTDLYSTATAAWMLKQFQLLIDTAVGKPESRLDELTQVLAAADRERRARSRKDLKEIGRRKLRSLRSTPVN